MRMRQIHLIITGRVQGVFFRASAQATAVKLKLSGWVKNLPDGTVETVAEGEKGALDEYLSWCRKGPPVAQVIQVDVQWEKATGEFAGFSVR